MAQSYAQIIIDIVFGTKKRDAMIPPEVSDDLYAPLLTRQGE